MLLLNREGFKALANSQPDFSKFNFSKVGLDDPTSKRKYLKNETNFDRWSGIQTTKQQYQLDHKNTFLELDQTIEKLENFVGPLDDVLEWTPVASGFKGAYDFFREFGTKTTPATLIFAAGGIVISLEKYQADQFIDMYNSVKKNYQDIHDSHPATYSGIIVNRTIILGPQNHVWPQYGFYDIQTHKYLGGRTFE